MNTTLLIMAAGLGSRFGTGIKQLTKVDEYGHIIMDYTVHDALRAGFNKIVFVLRREIEADFRSVIGERMEALCAGRGVEIRYAFQDLRDIPGNLPENRIKPWGTGQAVLCASDLLREPFAIVNADDYYGPHGLKLVYDHLNWENTPCMAGFRLRNTLSDHGGVTRGVCEVKDGYLSRITETRQIVKTPAGAESDGHFLDPDSLVSMNLWGFRPDFLPLLKEGFARFFAKEVPEDPEKAEFLIPVFVGGLLAEGRLSVRVLETDDLWYGMTYREDVAPVQKAFGELIAKGAYDPTAF